MSKTNPMEITRSRLMYLLEKSPSLKIEWLKDLKFHKLNI